MAVISDFLFRLRSLFRRRSMEDEMNEELRAHFERQVEKYVRSGLPLAEASRRARLEFGSLDAVKEECRDARGVSLIETTLQDVRYGLRMLGKNRGFTAASVLTLALGIGANTAIFSVANAVLLRPLPYQSPDRLMVILHHAQAPVSSANLFDWRSQNHVFESMGAAEAWGPNLTGVDKPESVTAMLVTPDVLAMLGVQPTLGRIFAREEGTPGREHEVVLDYRFWQRQFAGDPKVLGQSMTLDGEKYTVIGVMPDSFRFALFWVRSAELWAPLALANRSARGNSLRVFARLKPGISLEQARAEMATITAHLEAEYPGTNRNVTVAPLKEKVVGDIRPALFVLTGAVAFLLLIACANVAHMLLARGAILDRELAVRAALGAVRGRLVRQLLTESLLLAMAGGAAGLVLAVWGVHILVALSPRELPRLETIGVDFRVLLFMLVVSALTAALFGMVPAMRAAAVNLHDSLKEGGRGASEGFRGHALRNLLVASELALALVLLIGAGLMIRTLWALATIDPGFNPRNLLTMFIKVNGSQAAKAPRRAAFYSSLIERLRALPGVRSAGAINHLPLAGDLWGWPYWIEGRPLPRPGDELGAVYRVVMPGYFGSMEIPILRGRDIAASDNLEAPGVVIVNEHLARERWPGEDAIGRRISMDNPRKQPAWLTVVGVVKNARQGEWAEPADDEVYLPYLQNLQYLEDTNPAFASITLVVRTIGDPTALAPAIRSEISSLDRDVTVSEVQSMDQVVAASRAQPRFYFFLLAIFAAVALVLAAVGIYGVMSYSVSRRTHEIGIRMALGAKESTVFKLVTSQGAVLALVGVAAGLAGAVLLTRLMATFLYAVHPRDPLTFVAVSILLTVVALLASYIPARRASKVDPLVALRHE
jgi:putative ABC transport system permease protein